MLMVRNILIINLANNTIFTSTIKFLRKKKIEWHLNKKDRRTAVKSVAEKGKNGCRQQQGNYSLSDISYNSTYQIDWIKTVPCKQNLKSSILKFWNIFLKLAARVKDLSLLFSKYFNLIVPFNTTKYLICTLSFLLILSSLLYLVIVR